MARDSTSSYSSNRTNNPGANESRSDEREGEFVPGSSSIEENAILRRMERELGQEFTPRSNRPAETRGKQMRQPKRAPEAPRFNVTLTTGGQLSIAGRIALTQEFLELTEDRDGVAVRHRIPMPEIGQLEFLNWRAVRLHREPDSETRRLIYFPTRCRLTRRDQTQLEGEFAAFDWLEFRMQSGLSFGNYRTYFSVDPATAVAQDADTADVPESADAENPDAAGAAAKKSQRQTPAAPGSLADWNQRAAPAIPAEIVRSIVFGAPVSAAETPGGADDDAESTRSASPDDASTGASPETAGNEPEGEAEQGFDENFMETQSDAPRN